MTVGHWNILEAMSLVRSRTHCITDLSVLRDRLQSALYDDEFQSVVGKANEETQPPHILHAD
jgi:hypothetical protein